jgi:hypothetical protein
MFPCVVPNGFYGSQNEWEELEAPLKKLDALLEAYALAEGMTLSKNHRNWPERSLRWGEDVVRLMQLYLDDEKTKTYSFWICAHQDRGGERLWKHAFLKQGVPSSEIDASLSRLLEEGRVILASWSLEDLDFATHLW